MIVSITLSVLCDGEELPVYHIQTSNLNDVTGQLALGTAYSPPRIAADFLALASTFWAIDGAMVATGIQ